MRELSNGSRTVRIALLAAALALVGGAGGCASFSNPVLWQGVEVRRLPSEVLGRPREEERPIPLNLLTQPTPVAYLLDADDVLGIFIENVLGARDQPPPVTIREGSRLPPAVGFPVPIQEKGNLSLPLLPEPINLKGKTVAEAERLIKEAYSSRNIIDLARARVIVTLAKERNYHVNVVREDSSTNPGLVTGGLPGAIRRGAGFIVELPAYENDVLNALNRSGGLPGLDAKNEVIVIRAPKAGTTNENAATAGGPGPGCGAGDGFGCTVVPGSNGMGGPPGAGGKVIRIPLRLRPGEPVPFRPEDVILQSGDIVKIESRETELYYTGGLLPVGEFVLPRDYDLDVVEAIAQVRGPFLNGAVNFNNLSGTTLQSGIGNPSPSSLTVLRKLPCGGQVPIRVDLNRAFQDPRERILVKPGDVLILQETLGESFTRYAIQTFRFSFFFRLFNGMNENGSLNFVLP